MVLFCTTSTPDTFQLWSGFIGALLSGLVMVGVLIITLIVQTKQHKKQLKAQSDQFNEQQAANERLLIRQIELERQESTRGELLRIRSRIMIGLLDLERIASTGHDREKYAVRRYEVLAINREVKSWVAPEHRDDYERLGNLQDRVAKALANRINADIPVDDAFATEFGKLIGLVETWTNAYNDGDTDELQRVNKHVRDSLASLDEAEAIMKPNQ